MSGERYYEIRDPVYGFITISEWERDIINHPVFQRLRRIRQLAFTDLVYPGAMHSRFEHSLGAMHLAGKAYDLLTSSPENKSRLKSVLHYDEDGIRRARRMVRLAALLHDIGHGPFSHAAEELMPINPGKPAKGGTLVRYTHEDYSAAIIRIFFKDRIDGNKQLQTNAGITAEDVAGLLEGNPGLGSHLFWRYLLTSQLDVDRMDYLLRDSHHCGVRYGVYDLDRLLHTITITHEIPEADADIQAAAGETPLTIGVQEGGEHAAEELILARYAMFTQVYFHKARRAYDYHLECLLKDKLKNGSFPPPEGKRNLENYLAWDDWKVAGLIAADKDNEHAKRIRERDHYREVYHTREVPDISDIDLLQSICDGLGSLVRLQDSADKSWYKFKKEEIVVEREDGSRVRLSSQCPVVNGLRSVQKWRLYADRGDQAKAKKIVGSVAQRRGDYDDDNQD